MRSVLKASMICAAFCCCLSLTNDSDAQAEKPWIVFDERGRHIVLISGDEEYRSEEAMSQLARILSVHHGFKCTVLFAINPADGTINPNNRNNIPGLDALADAQLMVIDTRFRDLPDEQMKHIDDYLKRGGPVIGIRTATHGFKIKNGKTYSHYSNGYNGEKKEWQGGFGRLVLGEMWAGHHGGHKTQSTRGLIAADADSHPIVRGIKDGDIWGPTDVYGVRLPLPGDSKAIVLGQVLVGMRKDDEPLEGKKNDPMMPIGWTKTYQIPGGKRGRVFNTTMGSSTDLAATGTRRMIVNGVYWALGMSDAIPHSGTNVDIVGKFAPTDYGVRSNQYWSEKKLKPGDFDLK